MKKTYLTLTLLCICLLGLAGCGKEEADQPIPTETYVEENDIQIVHHDTENVDFRIALIKGDMATGFERLREDARREEAANHYRFYEYDNFGLFRSVFNCGTVDIATLSLEDALEVYEEDPEFICVLAVNREGEDGYGVTIATQKFARMYPFALQVFMEEMKYSAQEATCITGQEMRTLLEGYMEEQGIELPGDEFYYPLPELVNEEVIEVEEIETDD